MFESEETLSEFLLKLKKTRTKIGDVQYKEFLGYLHDYVTQELEDFQSDETIEEKSMDAIVKFIKDYQLEHPRKEQEKVEFPNRGHLGEITKENSLEVDDFLYSQEEVNMMIQKGEIDSYFCGKCGSRDIQLLNFFTHSLGREHLRCLFGADGFARSLIKKETNVLDIGSRLGPILWSCENYALGNRLIGVEIDKYFCTLSREIMKKFKTERVEIVESDIRDCSSLLQLPNLFVILHNSFEFFLSQEENQEIWKFLFMHFHPGTIIMAIPSLHSSFESLGLPTDLLDEKVVAIPFEGPGEHLVQDVHFYRLK